ncbi:MAG: acyl-CoA dehydrogenase family protein [Actinomycetota bacterium]|nr:acyl-CoA dehydrogenase family protein [Actinomycetota bacterium]
MAIDFRVEPEFQELLDWTREFVKNKIKPIDLVWPHDVYKDMTPEQAAIINPLKDEVRAKKLWACHLGPELGGQGYGQLKLALMNEILGTSRWAPRVFGTQAPDTGNAEIIAHFGTDWQKEAYLEPLLEGGIVSCYSMTEPQGGADPGVFTTNAHREGDEWVINGRKIWSSNARWATFFIVMVVTDPEAPVTSRFSMFLLPRDTPGITIEHNFGIAGEGPEDVSEGLVSYKNVRVNDDAMLGGVGEAFKVAQTRLGGGRVHHAMRTIGNCQEFLDMMAERALSRSTKGTLLAEKESVQTMLADSYIDLQQLRLFVLYTAWQIDEYQDYYRVRKDIAAIKVQCARVYERIATRALHLHGAIGSSTALPFAGALLGAQIMALVDGPTEVHLATVAKQLLRDYKPTTSVWPTYLIPNITADAELALLGREITERVPE